MVASTDYQSIKRSRKVGHAATLKAAPAYTWGKAREHRKDDPGPGPGEYDCSLNWRAKGVGFKSSSRYKKDEDGTPSPLDYKPTDVCRKSASSFSFRTKAVPEHLKSKTPGPGQYQPDPGFDATKPSTPAYSLLARGKVKQDCDATPAPNEYNATEYRNKEVHGASLKFRHSHNDFDPSPSPLDYADSNFRRPQSEGKTFGVSRPSSRLDNRSPAPDEYRPHIAAVRRQPQAWTMPRSTRDKGDVREVPGPGTYLHEPVYDRDHGHGIRSDNRSAPSYTAAGKPPKYAPDETPGPQDYVPKDPRFKTPASCSFHGVNSKDSAQARAPGPGTYDPASAHVAVRHSAPHFSLGLKHEDPALKERRPGPNEYNLKLDSKPGVSLKFRHTRSGNDKTPSPLDYADKDFQKIYMSGLTRKGYTFGVKPRQKLQESTPGPIYAIGCTTLGIAAAEPLTQRQLDQIAVL